MLKRTEGQSEYEYCNDHRKHVRAVVQDQREESRVQHFQRECSEAGEDSVEIWETQSAREDWWKGADFRLMIPDLRSPTFRSATKQHADLPRSGDFVDQGCEAGENDDHVQ